MTPPIAPLLLSRPALEARLDESVGKRLTLLIAGAGYGKSTLLAQWTADRTAFWYTASQKDRVLSTFAAGLIDGLHPVLRAEGGRVHGSGETGLAAAERLAATISTALQSALTHDVTLIVDDAHELRSSPTSLRLIESLCRQAPLRLHIVVATREPLALRTERLKGQGAVLELTGAELGFTRDEVAELVGASLEADDALALDLHAVTGGWPAAVRLGVEALRHIGDRERSAALAALRQTGSPLFSYLAHEVFRREPANTREFIRRIAPLDRFTPALCQALGLEHAADVLQRLVHRGLFVLERGGWFALHGLVRDFALAVWPLNADERQALLSVAGRWFESSGLYEEAMQSYRLASHLDDMRRLLIQHGTDMVMGGAGDRVLEFAGNLPPELVHKEMHLLIGDALLEVGRLDEALTALELIDEDERLLDPRVAWRLIRVRSLSGDLKGAREVHDRARDDLGEPCDRAHLAAWASSVAAADGSGKARQLVDAALHAADQCSDDRALADVHSAAAIVAHQEGRLHESAAHSAAALATSERAGDALRVSRTRLNRGSHLMDRGRYLAAISELDTVIDVAAATTSGYSLHALGNRGVAFWMLGRLDEARADFEDLLDRGPGPVQRAFGLIGIADVHRERGNVELARARYAEGLAQAEDTGHQPLVLIALCGLARSLVDEEPDEAERLALRAGELNASEEAWAIIARGWVALVRGDSETAALSAATALDIAQGRGQPYEIAEALELDALASSDPSRRRSRLEEAMAVWSELGNRVHVALAELALARLSITAGTHGAAARAERRLRSYGIRLSRAAPAGMLRMVVPAASPPIAVQTLGGFQVLRNGWAVPPAAWQSRKARDLFKFLIARRGRATPRELLAEALWPGDDPDRLGNRLSVALSTLRSVLDPERRFGQDTFVRTDRESVLLDLDTVLVDVEVLLREAPEALALRATGRSDEGRERLEYVASLYTGDFLEEDPYSDWAVSLREEGRATYVAVARALAEDAAVAGDTDAAASHFLRILGQDGYDESAHLGLVRALDAGGRRGEARRAYRAYVGRMEEIGATPSAFPA